MKKYFFLGVGVGLIFAGIFNFFTNLDSDLVNLTEDVRESTEIFENHVQGKTESNKQDIKEKTEPKQSLESEDKVPEVKSNSKEVLKDAREIEKKDEIKYIVQLGAFSKRENAQELIDKISTIRLKIIKNNGMYKVVTGSLDKMEKDKTIAEIKKEYGIMAYSKKIEE